MKSTQIQQAFRGLDICSVIERPINSSPSPFVLGVPLGESIRGLGKLFHWILSVNRRGNDEYG